MKVNTLALAGLVLLTQTLTGCGGSGGSAADDAAATAISGALMQGSGQNEAGFAVTQKQADCVGRGFVAQVGVDHLTKYGLLAKDGKAVGSVSGLKMSHADAAAAAGVMLDCTDAARMLNSALDSQAGAVDATTRACLAKILTTDRVRSLYTGIFEGEEQGAATKLTAPLLKCVAAVVPSM